MAKQKKSVKEIFDENHRKIVDIIIGKLGDDLSWEKPWNMDGLPSGCPVSGATGKGYSGVNWLNLSVIAWDKGYTDQRWYTFKGIKDMGLSLKDGEHGEILEHYGLRWALVDGSGDIVKMGWEKFKGDVPDGHEVHSWMAPHHFTTVFNAHQIEGLELQEGKPIEVEKEPLVDRLIASSVVKVSERPSDRAYCALDFDGKPKFIEVPLRSQFDHLDEFASTLAHEMTHSTGHELKRKYGKGKKDPQYAKEELVAEFGALFTCSTLGIDFNHKIEREDNSAAYIKSWLRHLKEDKEKLIYEAAKNAAKASALIVKRYEEAAA